MDVVDGEKSCSVNSEIGSITSPPVSISTAVAENGSAGIGNRDERNEPVDHMSAERTHSAMPYAFAPPDGCASTATPANPTPTPASTGHGSRSRPIPIRMTISHKGTDA